MNKKSIIRQHSETSISELTGQNIHKILGLASIESREFLFFYLLNANYCIRFFLDEGVLFLDTLEEPDTEDDLDGCTEYINISETHDLHNEVVSKATMENGIFQIVFESGKSIHFEQSSERITINSC